MKISSLLAFVLLIVCTSCNTSYFSSPFSNFDKKNLKEYNSNQGPWGGSLEMYWKSDQPQHFKAKYLIPYTGNGGWKFEDSTKINASILKKWTTNDSKPGFAFTYTDSFTDIKDIPFLRWITSDVTVYRFTTGKIAIEPDTTNETYKNGYVVLSKDGKELSVYHLWGE